MIHLIQWIVKVNSIKIGSLHEVQSWRAAAGVKLQSAAGISINVTPPEDEEADEYSAPSHPRERRKLSSPWNLQNLQPEHPADRSSDNVSSIKRRFSAMVPAAAAAAVSRRLSATLSWCLSSSMPVSPHIIRQGRTLCIQYMRYKIKRSDLPFKKTLVLQRLSSMLETESAAAAGGAAGGALAALAALCAALERTRPRLYAGVARQAARAPAATLRDEAAVAALVLALAREICKDTITWAKVASVYALCGSLAAEAAAACGEAREELLAAPPAAVADLLEDQLGVWVAAHGGWNGLVEYCNASEKDQNSERNLHILVSVILTFSVVLLFVRWLIPAPWRQFV